MSKDAGPLRWNLLTASVCLLCIAGTGCVQERPAVPTLAIVGVAVVDVDNGMTLRNQTVLVAANRITGVGARDSVPIPAGAQVVEAEGRFLIPGLWDMHTHLIDPDIPGGLEVVLPLLVANGVTGVRDMGSSSLDSIVELRRAVRDGDVLGPRIVLAGKVLDGLPVVFPPDEIVVRTAAEAVKAVDSLATRGVDFIKLYEMLPRDVFVAAMEAAKERGLPVAVHVPLTMDASEVSKLGVRSVEHLRNIELACSSQADSLRLARTETLVREAAQPDAAIKAFDWSKGYGSGALVRGAIHSAQRPLARATYDPNRCRKLLAQFAEKGTWQVPTLFLVASAHFRPDTMRSVRETLRYVPAANREPWERDAAAPIAPNDGRGGGDAQAKWYVDLVHELKAAGVGILAGTDISNPWMVPGFSLHEEMQALVAAGLTAHEALQAATVQPARYFEATDSLGAVARGRIADLVLLDGNPVLDIRNTRRIRAVILNGRYLDRAALDALLQGAAVAAAAAR